MRHLLLALLLAIPVALVSWVFWKGRVEVLPELEPARVAKPSGRAQLGAFFQEPLGEARLAGEVAFYEGNTLYEYINGAAPLFLQRQFKLLAAAELVLPEKSELTCDVYDMASPENAQSIFAAERSATAKPLDGFAEALAGPMSVVFREGRYYVKLTAFDEKAEAALPKVAAALKERLR